MWLVFNRMRLTDAAGAASGVAADHLLGGRWLGSVDQRTAPLPSALATSTGGPLSADLLQPAHAVVDLWSAGGEVGRQQHGCVRFATDGVWLHGFAELDDGAEAGNVNSSGMQAAAYRAYADIFEVLAVSPCPHLLRLWNYFAGINREEAGTERYRRFNAGRQQAFLEAQRSAFDGAPAASALGVKAGPLRVYFVAGRAPPVAVENPRQVSAYRYPDAYGPRTPTFSRAALVALGGDRTALFISGTASIVGHASVHIGDARAQTAECMNNITAVRDAAAMRSGLAFPLDALLATIYVRRVQDFAQVRAVFEGVVGSASAAARDAVYLQADVCRADLLVEIEAHVMAVKGVAA